MKFDVGEEIIYRCVAANGKEKWKKGTIVELTGDDIIDNLNKSVSCYRIKVNYKGLEYTVLRAPSEVIKPMEEKYINDMVKL